MVLITGVPGWLGSRLVDVLKQPPVELAAVSEPWRDARVRCLVQPGTDASALAGLPDGLEMIEGDLRDPAAMRRFCADGADTVLFHCAGLVHPRRWVREFYEVNVEGSRNILAGAEAAGVRRVVLMSSNSPLGVNRNAGDVFDESASYRPYMHYGRTKMLMEQAAAEFQARGKLETVVVRGTWFYGPRQPQRQTLFFRMIRDGTVPQVGDGGNRRSLTYVDNLCQGLLLCAASPGAPGETYWISDRRPYSMNEIVETVERLLEQDFGLPVARKRRQLPNAASEIARAVDGALQGAGLYHQKIHVLSEMNKTIACSIEKAQRDLLFRPTVALEEGMRRSLRWMLMDLD